MGDDNNNNNNNNRRRRQERRLEAIAEYKTMTRRLRDYNRDQPLDEVQEQIKSSLHRANELYPIVRKKLDGSSADARHLRELYSMGHEVSKRINTTTKPFEVKRIIQELRQDVEGGDNDETFYNYITTNHVNSFLLTPPTFEFFYGALRTGTVPVRERRKREPREKFSDSQAATAKEKDVDKDVDQDTTPKEVEHIYAQMKRLSRSEPDGIKFLKALTDPESFTNTVENIFHASFLVKEGKIGLKRDSRKMPVVTIESDSDNEEGEGSNEHGRKKGNSDRKHQSILSFSMGDYEKWISTYNIKERSFAPR